MLVLCIVRAASELIMLTPEMFGDKCLNKINYIWDPLQNLYYTKNVSNLTSAANAFMHEKNLHIQVQRIFSYISLNYWWSILYLPVKTNHTFRAITASKKDLLP